MDVVKTIIKGIEDYMRFESRIRRIREVFRDVFGMYPDDVEIYRNEVKAVTAFEGEDVSELARKLFGRNVKGRMELIVEERGVSRDRYKGDPAFMVNGVAFYCVWYGHYMAFEGRVNDDYLAKVTVEPLPEDDC